MKGLLKVITDHPEASLHCTCLVHMSLSIQGTTVNLVKRYALLLLLTTFKLCTPHTSVSVDITIHTTQLTKYKSVLCRYIY